MPSSNLDNLARIAAKPQANVSSIEVPDEALIQQSATYLSSAQARASIAADPYWPKWNGPWWHLMLLHEMGMHSRIPAVAIEHTVRALDTGCLHFFPVREDEVPAGVDPLAQVICHCQLGCLHQLLHSTGFALPEKMPWSKQWYMQYQLPDGGLNCDESAYTRAVPKSSVVSTLPALEAVLLLSDGTFSADEVTFLDRGAQYLIDKRLCRSSSSGKIIDESWLRLSFPRFYHYDALRGLSFLLAWAHQFHRHLPADAVSAVVGYIDNSFPDGYVRVQRAAWAGATTRWLDPQTASYSRQPAASFPLLEYVSELDRVSPYLTKLWNEARLNLGVLIDDRLLLVSETTAAL